MRAPPWRSGRARPRPLLRRAAALSPARGGSRMSDPMMRDQAPPNTELDLTALRAAGQCNVGRPSGRAPATSFASSEPRPSSPELLSPPGHSLRPSVLLRRRTPSLVLRICHHRAGSLRHQRACAVTPFLRDGIRLRSRHVDDVVRDAIARGASSGPTTRWGASSAFEAPG